MSPSPATPSGPVRGESDTEVSVRSVEDDEHVSALDDGTVRFVGAWVHTNHEAVTEGAFPEREPHFETTPFERWAPRKCAAAAGRAAADHVAETLGIGQRRYHHDGRDGRRSPPSPSSPPDRF
ncbi:hypothetical protein [Halomarina oriensis]|uniref:Uncharacterized protein n=1 Tax=Halomarina oriensis TaxID=671145 RepID=A0A6B0GG91_9EURY|nr:hypothetical protein [Halomarina oriensis]MWG33956.1 hypothetical protein [Halomarina oriensis]